MESHELRFGDFRLDLDRCELTRGGVSSQVSLLDIPPTLLWWFGLEISVCYEGRVLTQAFTRTVHPREATV